MKNEKLNVLAIASSPRRNGNSETLLDRALAGIKGKKPVIKKVVLVDLNIHPCTGCLACSKTGECIIKDDMQVLYEDLLGTDILLVAAPTYFKGLPCQLKCVIDRCQALWARKFVLEKELVSKNSREKRRGSAILVCASSGAKDMFTAGLITLRAWFNTLDINYKKELLAEGLEKEADALKNKKLLKKASEFGKGLM